MRSAETARMYVDAVGRANRVDMRRLYDAIAGERNGYPSGGYDNVGGTSDDTPTERAALAPDHAARALHDVERAVVQIRNAVETILHHEVNYLAPPRQALCAHCGAATGDRHESHCRPCKLFNIRNDRYPNLQEIVAVSETNAASGSLGGKAAAAALTAEQRSARAKKAGEARWQRAS